MATVGCEADEICLANSNIIDRFTKLPDGVSDHILSHLTFEDLARLGCVSKRCKELYLSTPSLDFRFYNQDTSTCNKRLQLMNYLDRFLVHRGDNKIQYFRVSWRSHSVDEGQELPCSCDDENFRMILTWIQNAVRCNVEKLVLKIVSPEDLNMMSMTFIFLCESLRSLVLKMFCVIHEAPSLAVSSNLRYLKLHNVRINDEGFFKWISLRCRFLAELILEEVRGINTITIESSSLKIFGFYFPVDICHLVMSCEKLEDIVIDWRFDEPSNLSINIFAPNLRELMWYGNVMNQRNLGKLECLERVILVLEPEVDYKNAYGLLCNLCWVRVLIINLDAIKVLFWEGCRPAQLHNIRFLKMELGRLSNDRVPAMVSLLKGMPNLCSLDMECMSVSLSSFGSDYSTSSGFNMDYWEKQDLAFMHKLQVVRMDLSEGSNAIHLARYILGNAPALKEMTICYSFKQRSVVRKLIKERPVSNGTLIFKQAKVELYYRSVKDCLIDVSATQGASPSSKLSNS